MGLITLLFILFLAYLLYHFLFFLTHLRPLTKEQMELLATLERNKSIKEHFNFYSGEISVNIDFKSSLSPNGKYYLTDESLYEFPSIMSGLLKGKKHEWVSLCLVKGIKVIGFYCNKGYNNQSVSFNCDLDQLCKIAQTKDCDTIMRFHNDPNGNPYHYNCLVASEQDEISARYCANICLNNNINWLDFVCERGNFIQFYQAVSYTFYPVNMFMDGIRKENGISKIKNYQLHKKIRKLSYLKNYMTKN